MLTRIGRTWNSHMLLRGWGLVIGCNHFGKQFGSFLIKHTPTMWSSHSTPRYLPKRKESICPKTYAWMFMVILFVITKTWKQPKCLSKGGGEETFVAHASNAILLCSKKEWTIYTCSDMDESEKLCAEWKTPDEKDSLLYDPIYMNSKKCKLICRDRKQITGCPGWGWERVGGRDYNRAQGNFWGWWLWHGLECGDGFMDIYIYI